MSTPTPLGALSERASTTPQRVALRTFELGVWREHTWADLAHTVAIAASTLRNRGVAKGQTVGLLCGSRAEWALCVWAAHACGAKVVAAPNHVSDRELEAIRTAHQVDFWISEGQEPFVALRALGVTERSMLIIDAHEKVEGLATWAHEVVDGSSDSNVALDATTFDDQSNVLTLWDENESWTMNHLATPNVHGASIELNNEDEYLSVLPPTWPSEASLLVAAWPVAGATVNFGALAGGGLAEVVAVQPTVMVAPAQWWDALCTKLTGTANEPSNRVVDKLLRGGKGMQTNLAKRSLQHKSGLARVREARTMGDVSERTRSFLAALGISLAPPMALPTPLQPPKSHEAALEGAQ